MRNPSRTNASDYSIKLLDSVWKVKKDPVHGIMLQSLCQSSEQNMLLSFDFSARKLLDRSIRIETIPRMAWLGTRMAYIGLDVEDSDYTRLIHCGKVRLNR